MNRTIAPSALLATEIFESSLITFFKHEADSITHGVSERNLCGRLALCMTDAAARAGLIGYYADVEYNRKQGNQVKTTVDQRERVIRITPDLILHSRGQYVGADNLVVIEMKKVDRPHRERRSDRIRLRAMTMPLPFVYPWEGSHPEHVCGYLLGIFILVDSDNRRARIEYFQEGHRTTTRQISFARWLSS